MAECDLGTKPKVQVKHDWYQTDAAVVITVLIKNVKADNLTVNFSQTCVQVDVKFPDQDDINIKFNLSHDVVPEQCSYKITPSKVQWFAWSNKWLIVFWQIEVKLKKSEGIRWAKLEGEEADLPKAIPIEVPQSSGPPAYPTSKKGKDWSVVEKEMKEAEAKEKPEGEEALNKLFQEIYGKGSDEVKRAMNKSYVRWCRWVRKMFDDWICRWKVGAQCWVPTGTKFRRTKLKWSLPTAWNGRNGSCSVIILYK
jgi:suppressor of G2 allele of SKP1